MEQIEKLIKAIKSEQWELVTTDENSLMFTTGRREYHINKRVITGYEFVESSIASDEKKVEYFKNAEDLITYILENKAEWEDKVKPFS